MISHFYATEPQRVWGCLLVPHLKAGNTEAAGVVGRSDHMNQERAVGDVLLVKLHRNLIITCRGGGGELIKM